MKKIKISREEIKEVKKFFKDCEIRLRGSAVRQEICEDKYGGEIVLSKKFISKVRKLRAGSKIDIEREYDKQLAKFLNKGFEDERRDRNLIAKAIREITGAQKSLSVKFVGLPDAEELKDMVFERGFNFW